MWMRYFTTVFAPPIDLKYSPNPDVYTIPVLPPVVEINHIGENGKLLDDATIAEILSKQLSEGHHTKQETHTPYNIFVSGDNTYAIYLGKKHNKQIGEGAFSVVKVAQNLNTGDWIVVKLHAEHAKAASIKSELEMINESDLRVDDLPIELYTRLSTKMMNDPNAPTNTVRQFLTQFKPGNLLRYILLDDDLPKSFKVEIAILLINKVQELHMKGIAHNDIHPGNVIYDPTTHSLSLIDYGKSNRTAVITSDADDVKKISKLLVTLLGENIKPEIAKLVSQKNPLNNVKDFLLKMKANLSKEEATMKIGVIDLQQHDEAYIKEHINNFKQANYIVFVDSGNEVDLQRYLACQQILANNQILSSNRVLTKHAPEALNDMGKLRAIMPNNSAAQCYQVTNIATSQMICEHDLSQATKRLHRGK